MTFDTYFALLEDFRACGFQIGRGARRDVQVTAFLREPLRNREADASRRAGNERGRSMKTQIHVYSSLQCPELATTLQVVATIRSFGAVCVLLPSSDRGDA